MKVNTIFIHCSDSTWGTAIEINKWHTQRGWKAIGYHFVILNGMIRPSIKFEAMDGQIEAGRQFNTQGAHVLNHNVGTKGICLIGVDKFTDKQMKALKVLLLELLKRYDLTVNDIKGHYEAHSHVTCPNIDMNWLRRYVAEEEPKPRITMVDKLINKIRSLKC